MYIQRNFYSFPDTYPFRSSEFYRPVFTRRQINDQFLMESVIYKNEWIVKKDRIGNKILRDAVTTARRPLQLARIWLQSIGFTRFRFVIL